MVLASNHIGTFLQRRRGPSGAEMDGAMNDRTINVSNSRPMPMVVPI
jgi:hypothetical protein